MLRNGATRKNPRVLVCVHLASPATAATSMTSRGRRRRRIPGGVPGRGRTQAQRLAGGQGGLWFPGVRGGHGHADRACRRRGGALVPPRWAASSACSRTTRHADHAWCWRCRTGDHRRLAARISQYVGRAPRFADLAAAGNLHPRSGRALPARSPTPQWRHLTDIRCAAWTARRGRLRDDLTPALARSSRVNPVGRYRPVARCCKAIRCPTLALRGAESDLLEASTLAAMGTRGPQARTVEFSGSATRRC